MGKPLQQPLGDITKEEFNQLIYLFLDGEASEEEVSYIETKCNSCEKSAAIYETECKFYNIIKTKLSRSSAPTDLADQIRSGLASHESVS